MVKDDALEVQPTVDKTCKGHRRDVVNVAVVARQRDTRHRTEEGKTELERLVSELEDLPFDRPSKGLASVFPLDGGEVLPKVLETDWD